eukprot:2431510-Rhodomonas_salina.1
MSNNARCFCDLQAGLRALLPSSPPSSLTTPRTCTLEGHTRQPLGSHTQSGSTRPCPMHACTLACWCSVTTAPAGNQTQGPAAAVQSAPGMRFLLSV